MTLTDYLNQAAENIGLKLPSTRDGITDYLSRKNLKKYFSDETPKDVKGRLKDDLERRVENSLEKYRGELEGFARKSATRGTMALAIVNDLSGYLSNVPFANVSGLAYSLFAVKTAVELPAMYRYLKKSHDWYGALGHYVMKPVKYLIPIIGPAWEAGSFEKLVKKRVMNEVTASFIKQHGDYQSFEDKLKEKLGTPIGSVISRDKQQKNADRMEQLAA
jgi:hypothetical protein